MKEILMKANENEMKIIMKCMKVKYNEIKWQMAVLM